MKKVVVFAGLALAGLGAAAGPVLSHSVAAQAYDALEGHYSHQDSRQAGGRELTADLKRVEGSRYQVSLSTMTPMRGDVGGCGGGVSGEAVLTRQGRAWSGVMRVANPSSARTAGAPAVCEIELSVSEPYRLRLKEKGGCTYFRGAACEFTGTVTHDAADL